MTRSAKPTGGPCKYKGKSMKDAHKGMGISSADFGALVGDLVAALDKAGVKTADKQRAARRAWPDEERYRREAVIRFQTGC